MEVEYNPKEVKEIIENSKNYYHQTIEEAWNILSKNAPAALKSLDSLLELMKKRTFSNDKASFNYGAAKNEIDEKHNRNEYHANLIMMQIIDNYFMAGIVKGISEYARKLDPKEHNYYEKVSHITGFINYLTDKGTFSTIYTNFIKKTAKEWRNKKKKSLKDYDDTIQEMSNYLANVVKNLLEDPIKNSKQFYKSFLETKSSYISKLTELFSKAFEKIRNNIL
jgi:hypothetical protein